MDEGFIETDLVDLGGCTLAEVRTRTDLGPQCEAVTGQAARPRKNLGSSGPPGRTD